MAFSKLEKGLPAVSTDKAKGAGSKNPRVAPELRAMRDQILAIPKENRQEREVLLEQLKRECSEETRMFLYLTELRELQHYWLMEEVLLKTNIRRRHKMRQHDFSKDKLFFFASASFFDGGVTDDVAKDFIFKTELVRHYTLEPHHPEYELYNEDECTTEDIREMGVDRLARNAQFGNGVITVEGVMKFLPKFTKGDNEAKQEIFKQSVRDHIDLVQEEFYRMYPNARDWSK